MKERGGYGSYMEYESLSTKLGPNRILYIYRIAHIYIIRNAGPKSDSRKKERQGGSRSRTSIERREQKLSITNL